MRLRENTIHLTEDEYAKWTQGELRDRALALTASNIRPLGDEYRVKSPMEPILIWRRTDGACWTA